MTTIRKLVKGSLRLINAIGANEEPSADDTDITLKAFNGMIDSMANDMLNIYTFNPYTFLLTPGKENYTLGPAFDSAGVPTGADWVIERPMRIEQAKLLLYPSINGTEITCTSGTLVLPIRNLTMMEYSGLRLRCLPNQWPTGFYDSGSYPTRKLSFWPVPTTQNAVELWLWEPLTVYSDLDEELDLPPGYERYLRFKLAVEISAEFGKELSPSMLKSLEEAETNVKKMNQTHPRTFASQSGAALLRNGRGHANIDSYPVGSIPRSW